MSLSIWLDDPADKVSEECEVAIIGGGIMGAAAAYWLGKRQGLKTVLFEAGELAGGASGRNAGFVLRGVQSYYNKCAKLYGRETARFIYGFAEQSQAYLKEFAGTHGNSFDLVEGGSYLLACSLEELNDLHESAELMTEDGFSVEYLKNDPLDRDYYGAIYTPSDLGVHPARLVRALFEAAQATLRAKEPVNRIEEEDDALVVHTAHRQLRCNRVLITTNAYTGVLEPWFKDKLVPARGQILVTQPLKKTVVERLCYANYGWEYFRQLPDRRFLLGGCRELHFDAESTFAEVVTPPVQASLEHYLKDRFPDIAGVPVDYRWAGIMAFTRDELPLVGELKSTPGVFFAVGCNGHGMGYGLAMSRLLVELALDGKDAGVFGCNRNAVKEPLTQVSYRQQEGP